MGKSRRTANPMRDFLNAYCQLKGTEPKYEWSQAKTAMGANGWRCVMRIPGSGETQATASQKKDAEEAATRDFVIRLQAMGVMLKMPGNHQQAPSGPSWAINGAPGIAVPTGKRPRIDPAAPHLPGAGPPGPASKGVRNIDSEMNRMLELLRMGQADEALEVAEERLDDCPRGMAVSQLAKLMTAVGVRSSEEAVLRLLDGLAALELVDFPNPPAAAYFTRFGRWAVREFLAEGAACTSQAATTIGTLLERQGNCIQHLIVRQGNKGGVELQLVPPGGQLPERHSFQVGDWVFLTSPHTGQVRLQADGGMAASFEAELSQVMPAPDAAVVVNLVGANAADAQQLWGQTCRIDRAANHVTFRRQIQALLNLCTAPGELDWLSLALMAAEEEGGYGKVAAFCAIFPPGGGFPSASPVLRTANQSQWDALQAATSRRVTLIQGPPGAGKTTTGVLLLRLWVATNRKPVLATADSNIAVDNLLAGCAAAGLQVVRVGRREGTRPELSDYNLYEKARLAGCLSGPRHNWRGEKKILQGADVVCCTCSGAEHPAMQDLKFKHVLVDEAGQATELATLIPLMHLQHEGSIVLIGDHRQLPATVACLEADVEGLGTSLFERLATLGVPPLLLDVQYRMHPAIAAFPSRQYYTGRLRTGVQGTARPPPQGIQWPVPECPIAFLPVKSVERQEGKSFLNTVELNTVKELLSSVLASRDMQPSDVGIITPYAAQARLFRDHLGLHGKPLPGVSQPEVSSVDGFQGREKELIFISTVRANRTGRIGFTGDPRRLNVMLTRARRGLVVVGDFDTLAQDANGWRPWLLWAQERGLIVGCAPTAPEAAAELRQLDGLSQAELLAAGARLAAMLAAEAQGERTDLAAAAGIEDPAAPVPAPGPRQRRKSVLMQVREEAERQAKAEATAANGAAAAGAAANGAAA